MSQDHRVPTEGAHIIAKTLNSKPCILRVGLEMVCRVRGGLGFRV